MKGIDEKFNAPKDEEVFYSVPLAEPEDVTPDFTVEEEESIDLEVVDSRNTCNVNNPRGCLSLYTVNVQHGYVWKLRANSRANRPMGITYGQKVGLTGNVITATTKINPGEIKDLGYGQFGSGNHRRVWVISAWWD